MKPKNKYDIAIVGGGIVGLAMAHAAGKRGKSVVVFERHPQAAGASVRNFGMVWPIGQPAGHLYDRAMRSREQWLSISRKTGMWARSTGSLHLAYHDDEMAVLEEFVEMNRGAGYRCQLVTPKEARSLSTVARIEGLKGALWSETEVNIHARTAIQLVADYIQKIYFVHFRFNSTISEIGFPYLYTFDAEFEVNEQIYICNGVDFETLYPSVFQQAGITKCKLQMMSTVSQGNDFEMGAMLCGGLTLRHYAAFQNCPSLQALSDRFDKENINQLILNYLQSFANIPKLEFADRWHGVYPKLNGETEFIFSPEEGVTIVNGLSGAGMTLSFGLAEEVFEGQLVG